MRLVIFALNTNSRGLHAPFTMSKPTNLHCTFTSHRNRSNPKSNSRAMSEQPKSIRALFLNAERARKDLATVYDTNSPIFQENLRSTIATYEECLELSEQVNLFSPNESLDDVSSSDIQ